MDRHDHIYRGTVIFNDDPLVKGRVKVFVYDVYPPIFETQPDKLPWAEPIMPLFGGSWKVERKECLNVEAGVSSTPFASKNIGLGASVWVMFENGDVNYPIILGGTQAFTGWLSEHPNQHVMNTENVRIRIDESNDGKFGTTTSKFDTRNSRCTLTSTCKQLKDVHARVDIEVWNKTGIAVNLRVKGDLNIYVEGNLYEEVIGDKHETIIGNIYKHHIGDLHYVHDGSAIVERNGDLVDKQTGDIATIVDGSVDQNYRDGYDLDVLGSSNFAFHRNAKYSYGQNHEIVVSKKSIETVYGSKISFIGGILRIIAKSLYFFGKKDIIESTQIGSIYRQSLAGMIYDKGNIVKREGLSILDQAARIDHNRIASIPTEIIYAEEE